MMLTIDLPAEIEIRLQEAADSVGKTTESCIREAILGYLEDMEDLYAAQREYAAIQSGESDTVPLHKVMEDYGMEY